MFAPLGVPATSPLIFAPQIQLENIVRNGIDDLGTGLKDAESNVRTHPVPKATFPPHTHYQSLLHVSRVSRLIGRC